MTSKSPLRLVHDARAEAARLSLKIEMKDQGGNGGGGGMDAWQSSVEARLGKVDTRLTSVESELSAVKVNIATLTERISHLPSKEYMVKIALGNLAFLTALIVFADKIKALIH